MKRTTVIALTVMLVLTLCIPSLAAGAGVLEVEQYEIRMPQIDVYFHPLASDGTEIADFASSVTDVKAVLGNKPLTFDSIERYTGGTAYYFLVDISGSIPADVFSKIKESITSLINGMSSADAAVLITFGEDVTTVLDGTESRTGALAAVAALESNDRITRFFDAVASAVSIAQSASSALPSRRVAFLFTDGKDVSDAGSTTADEMKNSLITAGLPLYALGIGSNKTYIDALGEFARSTGGSFASINPNNSEETLLALNERVASCYVIHLVADSNMINSGEEQLIIKLTGNGNEFSITKNVAITDWIPDTEAPSIDAITLDGKNEMTIAFSEAVTGADIVSNFAVTCLYGTEATPLEVRQAAYDDAEHKTRLTFTDTLYTGTYTVSMINIADRSMEANPLGEAKLEGLALTGEPVPTPEAADTSSPSDTASGTSAFPIWLIAVLAVCVIGGVTVVIIIVTSKHKEQPDAESAPNSQPYVMDAAGSTGVYVPGASGTRCRAIILDATGVQRSVDFIAMGPYTVGRSQGASDMAVDDKQLSRRHFQLTAEGGCLFIEDLGSTNGTEVNGVPIAGKRPLRRGDVITAGNSKFSFAIILASVRR